MSAKKKKKRNKGSGQGVNFIITLVTLSIVFVFVGYLIGQYAVKSLQEQHQTTVQLAHERPSAPVVTAPQSPPPTPAPPPPPPQIQEAPTLYRVQVGVFSERANADRMVGLLKEAGYEGIIIPGPPHRVQTGAFSSRENATRLMDELVQKGFEAIIVR